MSQPAAITRVPSHAFFAAPLLYAAAFGLCLLFPGMGEWHTQILLVGLPCVLVMSLLITGARLLAGPPRTRELYLALVINVAAVAFACGMLYLAMTFPSPD